MYFAQKSYQVSKRKWHSLTFTWPITIEDPGLLLKKK